jgi:fatty acid-binding protein DegV
MFIADKKIFNFPHDLIRHIHSIISNQWSILVFHNFRQLIINSGRTSGIDASISSITNILPVITFAKFKRSMVSNSNQRDTAISVELLQTFFLEQGHSNKRHS